jgi:glycosyltransferase involved in cell wall biosynthesis
MLKQTKNFLLKSVSLAIFAFPHQSCFAARKLPARKPYFVICTASYNNEKWAKQYLDAVFSQDYKKFRVIYYDDCSTDKTLEIVKQYAKEHNVENKIKIVHNASRLGPHENYYNMIHSCKNNEIMVINDGDDWLAHKHVLSRLAEVYATPDIWMTYGQFKIYPSGKRGCCRKIPDKVIEQNGIRSYKWVTSHLRTFYAWLYKQIKIEDLIFDGKFVKRAGDVAATLPMIEIAGVHSLFIPEILYIYNRANENNYEAPLGNAFASIDERRAVENELRKKRPKYQPLELDQESVAKLCGFDNQK